MNISFKTIISRASIIALIPILFLAAQQSADSNNTTASGEATPSPTSSPSLADSNKTPNFTPTNLTLPTPQSTSSTPPKIPAIANTASSTVNKIEDSSEPIDQSPSPQVTNQITKKEPSNRFSSLTPTQKTALQRSSLPIHKNRSSLTQTTSLTYAQKQDIDDDKVSIQFPHTSAIEVLALYEKLTGKHIIRDSNLSGPDLSIMVTDPVSKKDAISLLESSMLLNGYIFIPVDEKTVKVLGPSHPPRTEGLPLYQDESELPTRGEELVSFYQPLHFLSPNEAINVLQGVIQVNPYGSLVAVPNTSALVITDKTPVIRKALSLLQVIDHEPSQIITEFVPLQRANAEKIVDTLNQVFGKDPSTSSTPSNTPKPSQPPTTGPTGSITTGSEDDQHILSGKAQFIADKRTNRVLLITRAENYRYVRELISKLDQAVQFEEPLVRPLNYMSTTDVFPVLVQMLKGKDDDSSTNNTSATPQPSPQNAFNNNSSGSSGTNSSGTGGSNPTDRLNETQLQPPQSAVIGATSLIGDPTGNSIIVYGPPESKSKASQIIDLLDKRPQQVYLAAVIGQMKLDASTDFGTSYLFHYQGFNALASGMTTPANAIADAASGAVQAAKNGIGGLTLFGSIGGSLDVYANFLESTGKFRTIARPVVYTSNNRKATIFSGQSVPYNSSTLNSVVAGTTPTNTANSIQANVTYQDVTLKLEVIPLINSDNEINLLISQQNKTIDTSLEAKIISAGVSAPVINTQELNTSVRIPSGSTIVLGGLIQEDTTDNKSGVPGLSRIPVIGALLGGRTQREKVRKELVIMIQPIIVDSNFKMKQASDKEGGRSNLGQEAEMMQQKLQPTPTPTPKKKKKFHLFPLPKQQGF